MSKPIVVKAGSESRDPTSGISYPIPECLAALKQRCEVVVTEDEDESTMAEAVVGASVLMIIYGQVTRRVLEAGQPTLKAVIKMGTGIDSIDFAAARELGVRVTNCPDYARYAVAEGAFLLLINCFKKFVAINAAMRRDGWKGPDEHNKSAELFGKHIGLVGLGHINRQLVQMCTGFGMKISAYDPMLSTEQIEAVGAQKAECLKTMAAAVDALAVCVPLTANTEGLVSREVLEAMKPSAFLINVGRGATVDELALVELLAEGKLGGCGLDVYSQEPLTLEGHPMSQLLKMDNAVVLPHLAAWTKDTWGRLQDDVVEHVFNVLDDKPLVIRSSDPRLADQENCIYPAK